MAGARIFDPLTIDVDQVGKIVAAGHLPIIQFSGPTYSADLLREINRLCRDFNGHVEVRFFAHGRGGFDAQVLAHLPDVQRLSLDTLTEIRNEACLGSLQHLQHLRFGVYRFTDRAFLGRLANLPRLTHLTLGDNAKRDLDLAPLARAGQLKQLFLVGHRRGIEVLAGLPRLKHLGLSMIAKQQDLAFVSAIARLRSLFMILGGRSSIDEIRHQGLEELEIIRVRGLESLGDLARFPHLRRLKIEDQLQLRMIALAGPPLETLVLNNCKNLERLDGLDGLRHLKVFRARETKLDLDSLLEYPWPPSLQICALYSGSRKWNAAARLRLDERGYREHG